MREEMADEGRGWMGCGGSDVTREVDGGAKGVGPLGEVKRARTVSGLDLLRLRGDISLSDSLTASGSFSAATSASATSLLILTSSIPTNY
jgi:hypothetical protein